MTAEEKAKELIKKFLPLVEIHKFIGRNDEHKPMYDYDELYRDVNAKECANICVDEILSDILSFDTLLKDYYISVKEEINKL